VNLINAVAPGVLAESAKSVGTAFIHFSTDYVFDGTTDRPYIETDATNPLNVYGRSKLNGEKRVEKAGGAWLTCRTTWVYSLREGGFVKKILSWAKENETLRIVEDQIGGPTSSRMLAEAVALLLSKANGDIFEWVGQHRGLYHLAGDGYTSRFEWAKAILALAPKLQSLKVKEILPAASEDFPTAAQRPAFSALNCDKFARTFGLRLPNWRKGLQLMMASA
jgi:dTDP-4-dehydrorhamnose reductase